MQAVPESRESMELGSNFEQSSKDKNVWFYVGKLNDQGLKEIEETLEENESTFNKIDGYIVLQGRETLTFLQSAKLIGWALDKHKEKDVSKVLYRFIWMSTPILKDAISCLVSGLVADWIDGHRKFRLRR